MIWIDFGIICIGQEHISAPSNMKDIVVEGYQRTADSEPFYNKNYHFHTADKLLGCWYNVWLPEPIFYEESFFDIASKGIPYVEVVAKWSKYVETILSFYISQSPINKIAILLRVQDMAFFSSHFDPKSWSGLPANPVVLTCYCGGIPGPAHPGSGTFQILENF